MEFATSIAENVLGRLASYVSQEISLAWGAQLELTKLSRTLYTIRLLLQDAERKQLTNPLITLWLGNLKDVCHDVDDVLDKLEFQKFHKQVLVNNRGRARGKVRQFFSGWNPVLFNFKMGHKVKQIRERLAEIDNEKKEFALLEIAERPEDHRALEGMHDDRRNTTSLVEPSNVIGRDDDKNQIVKYLLHYIDLPKEDTISVISILGLGGLGKTTLAQLVYNDVLVTKKFETKMWICVSDNFDIKTLVRGITSAANGPNCGDESLDLMQRKLQDTLRGKKILLVLDDVWDTGSIGITINKWIHLKMLLNVGAYGSKIILTTRNESVVSLVNPKYKHTLQGLSHEDCMSLFIKRAFNRGEEQRYPYLIEIGENIVKKCGGVPLAVTTLGSMLFLKRERQDWAHARDSEIWSLRNEKLLPALKLSYDALPLYLKPCFAFCSLFPKDYLFRSTELISLWMAQGYLKSSDENQDLKQIGLDYVRQFLSRCLFQVKNDLIIFITFKIHDLVHDLAISVAQVEFSTINSRPKSCFETVRYVSISRKDVPGEDPQVPNFMLCSEKLRTIMIFEGGVINESFLKICISRFKYMRALDLARSPLKELHSSISSLCHLRFLNLSGNRKIILLPKSICKLLALQTLHLRGCAALEEIPREIGNLINLRHLSVTTKQKSLPEGIKHLKLLQVLQLVNCVNLKSLGAEIQYLSNLCALEVNCSPVLESLPPTMKHLTSLTSLFIYRCEKLELMIGEGPPGLSLCEIFNMSWEVLPPWLQDSADTLQCIDITSCNNLTQLQGLENFRFLKQLKISYCPKLLALPHGWHSLTELRELSIFECRELSKSCERQLKCHEWSEIAHDPYFRFEPFDSVISDVDEEEEHRGTLMIDYGADGVVHIDTDY